MSRSLGITWVAIVIAGAAMAAGDTRFDPHHLATPSLRPLQVPMPKRTVLANGVVVLLLEDHRLPVVNGIAYFPSSPTLVPDAKMGLAELTGDAMRRGGTSTHPGDALDDRLGALGATISTSLDADLGYAGLRCQTEDVDEVMG